MEWCTSTDVSASVCKSMHSVTIKSFPALDKKYDINSHYQKTTLYRVLIHV